MAASGWMATSAPASAHGWIVNLGARVGTQPGYEGADHNLLVPGPTLSIKSADAPDRFSPHDENFSIALISAQYISLGPVVRFRAKRSDEGMRQGLTEVGWAAEPGGFIDLWPTNFLRLHAEGRKGFGGHHGWLGDGGVDLVYTGKRWGAAIGPRYGWGDNKYMRTYFGVTPSEAAASPFIAAAYAPGQGERYAGVEASAEYKLTSHWKTSIDFGYHRLSDKAAASPIVQVDGSRHQYIAGVSLSYMFGIGIRR